MREVSGDKIARIGKYRIIRELGRGGMGVVYLAEDTRLQRQVALKILHPFLSMDEEFVRRFTSEAQAIAALSHGGIVRVHAFEEVDGSHLIDMEYIEGGSLDRQLQNGRLNAVFGIGVALRVFEALAACHERGIIHRDIKPSNILLASDGRVLLSDFGLARSYAVAGVSSATTSSFIGTPKYAAPESWEKGGATPAGDVYSAGLVLLELLAGRTPYDGDSTLEIMRKLVASSPMSARVYLPAASDALVDLLDAMLNPAPSARPATAAIALKRLRETPEIISMPEDQSDTVRITPVRMPIPAQTPPRRRTAIAITLLAAVAALLGWTAYVQRPDGAVVPRPAENAPNTTVPAVPTPESAVPSPEVNNVFLAGERIVFAATVGEWRSLWTFDLAAKAATPLWPELTLEPEDDLHGFQPVNRGVVAVIRSPLNGHTLFRTDGTRHGTIALAHVSSWHHRIVLFASHGGEVYFCRSGDDKSNGIWKTNGTIEGTRHLWGGVREPIFTSMGVTPSGGLYATSSLGGPVYFFPAGASEPMQIGENSRADQLLTLGERIIVERDDYKGVGRELWAGSANGDPLTLLKDFMPGGEGGAINLKMGRFQDEAVFGVATPEHGQELWMTDGTVEGTRLLRDINPGPTGSEPMRFVESGEFLYFNARDDQHGEELWLTDGTTEGTRIVRDILPGWRSADPHSIRPFNGGVLFTADDGAHGEELWFSDGTEGGTRLVLDCMPGPEGRGDFGVTVAENSAYFSATHPDFGRVLWETDGTAAGTRPMFERLNPYERPVHAPAAWAINGHEVLTTITTPELGAELWITSMATAEAKLHMDIRPGPESSNPRDFIEIAGVHYFVADDGLHGAELWCFGGHPEFTKIRLDAWEGRESGNPREFTFWPPDRFAFVIFDGRDNLICYIQSGDSEFQHLRAPDLVKSRWDPTDLRAAPDGWLYFSNQTHSGETTIWRTDGTKVERVPGLGRAAAP